MATISQPIWILVGVIGIADIFLFWWCLILLRRARRTSERTAAQDLSGQWPLQPFGAQHFQQKLVGQQIDAVFNGLVALIETERIKLKSLINPMTSVEIAEPRSSRADLCGNESQPDSVQFQEAAIGQQVVQFAASGQNPTDIAHRLGISLAEVNLAMQMQSTRRPQSSRKLEAVA